MPGLTKLASGNRPARSIKVREGGLIQTIPVKTANHFARNVTDLARRSGGDGRQALLRGVGGWFSDTCNGSFAVDTDTGGGGRSSSFSVPRRRCCTTHPACQRKNGEKSGLRQG